jgi:Ran GTPase-activating protein (RanGAP) involved in mRNA processing and transport
MIFMAGDFSMNAMVPATGDPKHGGQLVWLTGGPVIADQAVALGEWQKHIKISVARAQYCKKEEALAKEPDNRVLNFVDSVEDAVTLTLCGVELGLEAVVCLQGTAAYARALKAIVINNAGVDDLQCQVACSHPAAAPAAAVFEPLRRTQVLCMALAQGQKTLETLNLSDNFIGSDGAEQICKFLLDEPQVTALDLSDNEIQDFACSKLAQVIGKLQLKSLSLGGNQLEADGLGALCVALAADDTLQVGVPSASLCARPTVGQCGCMCGCM